MTVCTRCVLDTSVPNLRFDENGVCDFCHQLDARAASMPRTEKERAAQLASIVARVKKAGQRSRYDCVIGLSGGVDSSYAALVAVELGLRPLAVHVDNGWNTETAVQNIERIVRGLKLDLITYVIDWEEFRGLQLSLLRAGVVDLELVSDHAIIAGMYKAVRRAGIRHIVTGDNHSTEATLPAGWNHRKTDLRNIKAINRAFERVPMSTFPQLSTVQLMLHNRLLRIEYIGLLTYVDYNKARAVDELEQKLGYRRYEGKHFESIITRFYQGYILPTKFGIDKRKLHLSLLIHSGQKTRDEALAILQEPPYARELVEADRRYVCKKFGISLQEFDAMMSAAPRSHLEYASDERLLGALLGILRALRRVRARITRA